LYFVSGGGRQSRSLWKAIGTSLSEEVRGGGEALAGRSRRRDEVRRNIGGGGSEKGGVEPHSFGGSVRADSSKQSESLVESVYFDGVLVAERGELSSGAIWDKFRGWKVIWTCIDPAAST
jgi:hypothetical protein